MEVFRNTLIKVNEILEQQEDKSKIFNYDEEVNWEIYNGNEKCIFILKDDVGVELGHPSKQSVYFMLLLGKKDKIDDGKITLIGNDVSALKETNNSFGQIVLIKGRGFNELNIHERYMELDLIKSHVNLDGYMFRARPDRGKEYTRVSKKAIQDGIDFNIIGSKMIKKYKELDYVDEVEIIFITDEDDTIKTLQPSASKIITYVDSIDKSIQKMVVRKYMEKNNI